MKTILLVVIGCFGLWLYSTKKPDAKSKSLALSDSIRFKQQVQPIFEKRCSPCHFPGGKLYERLPFDRALTIIEHKEGIMKRIKNEEDRKLIEAFVQQEKK